MKNLGLFSLLILLVFSACRKDIDMVTVTEETPNPEIIEGYQPLIEIINGDLIGQVLDIEGIPVSDATVNMGTNNTTTDIYGHFFFNDVDMNAKGQYVTIEKEGFFLGSRRFFPQADAKSRVRVEMINKTFNQSFNTNEPETINFGNVSIDFPANGIVTENGSTYNGDVFVAAQWLNPTTRNVYDQMPGNLQGVNADNEEVSLKTLGMVAVELQGENGEKLNIMEGASAAFVYAIPDASIVNSPTEVPLWSFNEEVGIWVIEGVATLGPDGASYIGEFTHFSFWNWDIPVDNIYFSTTFQDQDGNPLYNVMVTINSESYGTGYGYTDDLGYVAGYVPAGEVLTLNVWAAFGCNNVFYTDNIGPFDADTNLGVIMIENASANATSVSGTLVNCDGDNISGVAIVNLDGYQWYNYTEDGDFSFYLNNCSELGEMSLTGYDFDALLSSAPIPLTPNTDNEVGPVLVCINSIEQDVLTFTTPEGTWTYPISANYNDEGLFIQMIDFQQDSVQISFYINPDEVSLGVIESGGVIGNFNNYTQNPAWTIYSNPDIPYFDYLEITELGDYVSGNFSFTAFTDPNGNGGETVVVTGEFNAFLQ